MSGAGERHPNGERRLQGWLMGRDVGAVAISRSVVGRNNLIRLIPHLSWGTVVQVLNVYNFPHVGSASGRMISLADHSNSPLYHLSKVGACMIWCRDGGR
jgi:hypothetical protein